MDTIHFYVIQTGLFLETFNGPTEQFCIHGQLSLGGNVSLIRSSIKGACVCVCGGGGGIYWYSMILPQFLVSLISMNMQMR